MRKIIPPRKKKFFHKEKKIDYKDIQKVHRQKVKITRKRDKRKKQDPIK